MKKDNWETLELKQINQFQNFPTPRRNQNLKTRSVLWKVGIRFHLIHLLHMTVTVRANKKDHLVAVKNAYG